MKGAGCCSWALQGLYIRATALPLDPNSWRGTWNMPWVASSGGGQHLQPCCVTQPASTLSALWPLAVRHVHPGGGCHSGGICMQHNTHDM